MRTGYEVFARWRLGNTWRGSIVESSPDSPPQSRGTLLSTPRGRSERYLERLRRDYQSDAGGDIRYRKIEFIHGREVRISDRRRKVAGPGATTIQRDQGANDTVGRDPSRRYDYLLSTSIIPFNFQVQTGFWIARP